MASNGRFYYEGIPLGNLNPISHHPQLRRSVRGVEEASNALFSSPRVGIYGYGYQITIKGQHQVAGGDFVIWASEVQELIENCARHSKDYEDRAIMEHAVLSRKLGILAWVPDVDLSAAVSDVSSSTASGAIEGQIRISLSSESFDEVPVLGDVIVLAGDGVGECGVVLAVSGSNPVTSIDIAVRRPVGFGGTNYSTIATGLTVYHAKMWYPNTVFRDATWGAPRNMSEAGDTPAGISFLFDSKSRMVLRGEGAVTESLETSWDGSWEYGSPYEALQLIYGDEDTAAQATPSQP